MSMTSENNLQEYFLASRKIFLEKTPPIILSSFQIINSNLENAIAIIASNNKETAVGLYVLRLFAFTGAPVSWTKLVLEGKPIVIRKVSAIKITDKDYILLLIDTTGNLFLVSQSSLSNSVASRQKQFELVNHKVNLRRVSTASSYDFILLPEEQSVFLALLDQYGSYSVLKIMASSGKEIKYSTIVEGEIGIYNGSISITRSNDRSILYLGFGSLQGDVKVNQVVLNENVSINEINSFSLNVPVKIKKVQFPQPLADTGHSIPFLMVQPSISGAIPVELYYPEEGHAVSVNKIEAERLKLYNSLYVFTLKEIEGQYQEKEILAYFVSENAIYLAKISYESLDTFDIDNANVSIIKEKLLFRDQNNFSLSFVSKLDLPLFESPLIFVGLSSRSYSEGTISSRTKSFIVTQVLTKETAINEIQRWLSLIDSTYDSIRSVLMDEKLKELVREELLKKKNKMKTQIEYITYSIKYYSAISNKLDLSELLLSIKNIERQFSDIFPEIEKDLKLEEKFKELSLKNNPKVKLVSKEKIVYWDVKELEKEIMITIANNGAIPVELVEITSPNKEIENVLISSGPLVLYPSDGEVNYSLKLKLSSEGAKKIIQKKSFDSSIKLTFINKYVRSDQKSKPYEIKLKFKCQPLDLFRVKKCEPNMRQVFEDGEFIVNVVIEALRELKSSNFNLIFKGSGPVQHFGNRLPAVGYLIRKGETINLEMKFKATKTSSNVELPIVVAYTDPENKIDLEIPVKTKIQVIPHPPVLKIFASLLEDKLTHVFMGQVPVSLLIKNEGIGAAKNLSVQIVMKNGDCFRLHKEKELRYNKISPQNEIKETIIFTPICEGKLKLGRIIVTYYDENLINSFKETIELPEIIVEALEPRIIGTFIINNEVASNERESDIKLFPEKTAKIGVILENIGEGIGKILNFVLKMDKQILLHNKNIIISPKEKLVFERALFIPNKEEVELTATIKYTDIASKSEQFLELGPLKIEITEYAFTPTTRTIPSWLNNFVNVLQKKGQEEIKHRIDAWELAKIIQANYPEISVIPGTLNKKNIILTKQYLFKKLDEKLKLPAGKFDSIRNKKIKPFNLHTLFEEYSIDEELSKELVMEYLNMKSQTCLKILAS